MSKLRKSNYDAIADILSANRVSADNILEADSRDIAHSYAVDMYDDIVKELADYFETNNPAFRRQQFYGAARRHF